MGVKGKEGDRGEHEGERGGGSRWKEGDKPGAHSKRGDAQDWACWMLPQARAAQNNSPGRSAASQRLQEAMQLQPQNEFEP